MNTLPALGEPREETFANGGGVAALLSGGDEHSEAESLSSFSVPTGGNDAHEERAASERGGAAPGAALPCQESDMASLFKQDSLFNFP